MAFSDDDLTRTGVYLIRNKVNDKKYVGSASRSFEQRWRLHRNQLNRGDHVICHLQASWLKYGQDAFEFTVLEYCNPEQCTQREQYWMDHYDVFKSGYNRTPTAGSQLGFKFSKETLKKLSLSHMGQERTPETRAKISKNTILSMVARNAKRAFTALR